MSYTQDLKNRGMKRLAAERERISAERQLHEQDRKRIAWPQTIQYDIDEAQRLLDSIGAPRMTGQTTQLGDVLSRLLWCVYNTRVLEQAKENDDE